MIFPTFDVRILQVEPRTVGEELILGRLIGVESPDLKDIMEEARVLYPKPKEIPAIVKAQHPVAFSELDDQACLFDTVSKEPVIYLAPKVWTAYVPQILTDKILDVMIKCASDIDTHTLHFPGQEPIAAVEAGFQLQTRDELDDLEFPEMARIWMIPPEPKDLRALLDYERANRARMSRHWLTSFIDQVDHGRYI